MPDKKTVQNIALCRKSGSLVCGFDAVKNGLTAAGKSRVSAVLLTADASEKTAKEIAFFAGKAGISVPPKVTRCGFTADEISAVLGKRYTVLGVCGENFIKMLEL